jgi:Ca2+-transporting ATPase
MGKKIRMGGSAANRVVEPQRVEARILKGAVGSLVGWQMERQFRILNDKEECSVKVVRSSIERVMRQGTAYDDVLITGHNVKYNEPGATGKSNATKKVSYDGCIALREQAKRGGPEAHGFDPANARTDCFMVSGCKVLEGYDKYVLIAVSQKTLNDRTMWMCFGNPLLVSGH